MNHLELIQTLHRRVGESPVPTTLEGLGSSTIAATLVDLLRRVYNKVVVKKKWWWLETSTRIRLVAPITGGTIVLTEGSASVVGTGTAFTGAEAGYILRPTGDRHYYTIKSIESDTSATLEETAIATSTDVSYNIYKYQYALPRDYKRILEVVNLRNDSDPLEGKDMYDFMRMVAARGGLAVKGWPQIYTVLEGDTTTKQRYMIPWPLAEEAMDLDLFYKQAAAPLDGDFDEHLIPEEYEEILIDGVLMEYYTHIQPDARASVAGQGFDGWLADMLREHDTHDKGDFRFVVKPTYRTNAIAAVVNGRGRLAHQEVQDRY